MRIAVVNVAAQNFGALSVLNDLYNYACNFTDHEWLFILSDQYLEAKPHVRIVVDKRPKKNWLHRLKWDYLDAGTLINNLKPDVVFNMQNILVKGVCSPQVLYMHNVIPFQRVKDFSFFRKEERIFAVYQYLIGKMMKRSIRDSTKTIVQCQWLKTEILKSCRNVTGNNILVVPTNADVPPNVRSELVKGEPVLQRIFFYPAAPTLFKNHGCILEAVKLLNERGNRQFTVELTLNDELYVENVKCIGTLERSAVFTMYTRSVLLFPSYIESYGLPLLEARRVGAVVIASNCNFSHEILEGYPNVLYFDPFSPSDLASKMSMILNGEFIYEQDNQENMRENSWKEVVGILEKVAK